MEQEYENLIIGYLTNRLGKADTEKFFSWIEEDEKNKQLFFEIKAVYEAAPVQMDAEKSWKRLLNKRERQLNKKYSLQSGSWKSIMRYAAVAAIAIFITSSGFLYFLTGKNNQLESQAVRYISGSGLFADIVELPDGTQVQLAASSTLQCNAGYGKTNREVYLDGEAFFDVAKFEGKLFVVNAGGQKITALGTKFNVSAFSGDSVITTTLLEGSVKLETGAHLENILMPNQQLVYHKINQSIDIVEKANATEVISWTTGYYHFAGETLEKILLRMGNILGARFNISSDYLKNKKFSGTFYSGQNSRDILEIINLSIPITYKIEGNQITITE